MNIGWRGGGQSDEGMGGGMDVKMGGQLDRWRDE